MKTVRLAVLCAALCLLTAGVILLTAGTAPARTSHTPSPEAIEALEQKYGLEPPVSPPPSALHVDVGWSYK